MRDHETDIIKQFEEKKIEKNQSLEDDIWRKASFSDKIGLLLVTLCIVLSIYSLFSLIVQLVSLIKSK